MDYRHIGIYIVFTKSPPCLLVNFKIIFKMDFTLAWFFFSVLSVSIAHEIRIVNKCTYTIWPGIQGNPGHEHLGNGGFVLESNADRTFTTPQDWAGRIWGRTNCDAQGHCETGDCGNKIECNGAGGVPPASLAEATFTGAGGLDYYDVSLVDGYNMQMTMVPTSGFTPGDGGPYDCKAAGCTSDLNQECPAELAVKNGDNTVACMSACMHFNTDQYCCRGEFNSPDKCHSNAWPVDYPALFKRACPAAYSYAYDDQKSTFTCRGNPSTHYDITFCP